MREAIEILQSKFNARMDRQRDHHTDVHNFMVVLIAGIVLSLALIYI